MAADDELQAFSMRWETFKANDAIRNNLMDHLLAYVRDRHSEILKLKDEAETFQFHEENYKEMIKALRKDKRELEEQLDTSPFVMVLVDGDNSLFLDKYVKAGIAGGHQAAQLLSRTIEDYLKETVDFKAHWNLLIRIYVNQFGLSEAYNKAGVTDARTVREFFVGFNRELPFAEFVDVGSDKEAADNKIRENLSLFYDNGGCKHVILAGSADRGYVSFLRKFSARSDRLTLVESVPFPTTFRELSAHFSTKKFETVFRSEKLISPEQEPAWSAVRKPSNASVIPSRAPAANAPSPPPDIGKMVLTRNILIPLNRNGDRVDRPLPLRDPITIRELKPLKLCTRHYLTNCTLGKPTCQYKHDKVLSEREKVALAHLSRESRCSSGPICGDRNCVLGHHCAMGKACHLEYCRFTEEMHLESADREIVKEM